MRALVRATVALAVVLTVIGGLGLASARAQSRGWMGSRDRAGFGAEGTSGRTDPGEWEASLSGGSRSVGSTTRASSSAPRAGTYYYQPSGYYIQPGYTLRGGYYYDTPSYYYRPGYYYYR